jgi:hypothetical protein
MSDLINTDKLRARADALRAVKHHSPQADDSAYSLAYTEGLTALVTQLLDSLGGTADTVADTLRAAGITGHTDEGRMVGEQRPPRLNPVSAWLRSLLGPGHYQYSGPDGYLVDLETAGETEDTDAIAAPEAVRAFLDGIEDPYDDEVHRYRGLTIDDDGRLSIYLPADNNWVCAAIPAATPDGICGIALPCPVHPLAD